MILQAFSTQQQIIQTGRSFQLLFLIFMALTVILAWYLARGGRTWTIRPLEGLEAMREGVGRAAEMGRPILVLPGIGSLSSIYAPQTVAGLTALGEVAQRAADVGIPVITSSSPPEVVAISEAIIRSSLTSAGKGDMYEPGKYVRWFGGDQFSYAVGASGQILEEKPAMVIYMGYFLYDVIVTGETGNRVGALQVGGTLGSIFMMAMFCDYILVGEEMYAASAAITGEKFTTSTIASQDWTKVLIVALTVLGVLAWLVGSRAFWTAMGA